MECNKAVLILSEAFSRIVNQLNVDRYMKETSATWSDYGYAVEVLAHMIFLCKNNPKAIMSVRKL